MPKKESEMTPVVLERNWPGVFTRAVRNEDGEVAELLKFQPGIIKPLTDIQLNAVQDDLGKCLSIVEGITVDAETNESEGDQGAVPASDVFPFDGKTNAALFRNGIKTLDQLKGVMSLGENWYESVDGIGETTAGKIVEALAE